ncbi:hypothetical protein [Streptomyces sp. NPDC000410]|uniref:hypothetical protein n=1 Tax=Streptomyces sp. NPDC000410 TaxID=3154254 RepID=UPI00331C0988
MKRKRGLGRMALVGAIAAGPIATTHGSAYALTYECWDTGDTTDPGGRSCLIRHQNAAGMNVDYAYFNAYDETLTLSDYEANGEGVVAYVEGNRFPLTSGANTSYTWDLDYAEGTSVMLKSCQTDNGSEYDCKTVYAIA